MIEYIIDRPDRLVRVRMSGCITSADLARHYSKVHDDPSYDASFNILFQIDEDAGGPIMAELPDVGSQMEAVARLQHRTKWAIVMAPGIQTHGDRVFASGGQTRFCPNALLRRQRNGTDLA